MPNQMIALQARSPQLPDPSRRTAQFVNMMNMARQQEAAQRQAELAQQTMDIEAAKEARAVALQGPALTKAQQDNIVQALGIFREAVGDIAEGDVAAAEAVRADLVSRVPGFDKFLPPASTWDRNTRNRLMMTAEKEIDKTFATPTTETIYGPNNEVLEATRGGMPGVAGVRPLLNMPAQGAATPASRATPTAPQAAAPASVGEFGEAKFVNPESVPLTPYQQEHIREMQNGLGMSQPASFTRGAGAVQMTPEVAQQIVDTAVKTGMMAQADFDQLMALAPEQNKQPFMDMLKANNIALQPGGAGQQSQFAVYRGQPMQSRGAPPMEQTLAQTNVMGQQAYGRSASPTSPLPGSSQVPLSRVGAEKTTEAQATADVNLRMAPEIAKATKLAERAIELKSDATKSKYATEGILNDVVDRINTIDELLRNPNRFSIVGPIEGNLPRIMQYGPRADVQAAFDKIKNTATLTSLIDMRKSTETGASPVGANPTDKDAKIVEQAASKLIQTGEPSKFDAELIDMRRKLYRTYQSAQREHEGVYGDVLKDNPRLRLSVPKVSDRYLSTKDLPKQKTQVKTPTSRLSAETRAKYGL